MSRYLVDFILYFYSVFCMVMNKYFPQQLTAVAKINYIRYVIARGNYIRYVVVRGKYIKYAIA